MRFINLLWRFIPQFKWRIIAYILLNIMSSICSAFSFLALIPLVKIIFGIANETLLYINPETISSFSSFLDVMTNNLLYFFQSQISVFGLFKVLVGLAIFIITMSFLSNLISYFAYWVRIPIRTGIGRDLRSEAYSKIVTFPILSLQKENRGDFASRMTNDVEEVEFGIGSTLDMLIKDPIQIIIYVFTLFHISHNLTIFALLFLLLCCAFVFIIGNGMKTISLHAQNQRGQILSVFEQTIGALHIIKSFNAEKESEKKFNQLNNSITNTLNRQNRFYSLAYPCTDFLSVTILSVVLCVGGTFILNGKSDINGAEFIAFLCIFYSIISPIRDMMKCTFGIRKAIASLERLHKITLSESENYNSDNDDTTHNKNATDESIIEFRNVSFSYGNYDVLKNISLKVTQNTKFTIIGHTGSGKSTIIKLILGFFDATKGQILFQGTDIKNIDRQALRDNFAYVSQDQLLFNDTIFNNIILSNPNATKEEIINAAKIAHIHDFIMTTEQQYDTIVGDCGSNLSGGQRQCITIARAILKKAPILILDEATSMLDPELERKILYSIDETMKDRTIITITHRIYPVSDSDQICVLENGEIAMFGNFDEVQNKYRFEFSFNKKNQK